MRTPRRYGDPPDDAVIPQWPRSQSPTLPRGRLISLGLQRGWTERFIKGKGMAREIVEYELFVERRASGASSTRQWHRYKDRPSELVYQGDPGPTPLNVIETVVVSRSSAREISMSHRTDFDPTRVNTTQPAHEMPDW